MRTLEEIEKFARECGEGRTLYENDAFLEIADAIKSVIERLAGEALRETHRGTKDDALAESLTEAVALMTHSESCLRAVEYSNWKCSCRFIGVYDRARTALAVRDEALKEAIEGERERRDEQKGDVG